MTPMSSLRKFAATLGLIEEEERVFVVACPRRLADVTVLREVTSFHGSLCMGGAGALTVVIVRTCTYSLCHGKERRECYKYQGLVALVMHSPY